MLQKITQPSPPTPTPSPFIVTCIGLYRLPVHCKYVRFSDAYNQSQSHLFSFQTEDSSNFNTLLQATRL